MFGCNDLDAEKSKEFVMEAQIQEAHRVDPFDPRDAGDVLPSKRLKVRQHL
jgi:hypothetical protein